MNEAMTLGLAGGAGVLLGAVFYGGLWWTIRQGVSSKQPALWFVGSLVVRMSVAVGGMVLVARGHWERLLLCLLGLVMARLVVTWLTRPAEGRLRPQALEGTHAP